MESATVKNRSMQKSIESILQDALDILESDDGKSFEEKKALLLRMLSDKQDTYPRTQSYKEDCHYVYGKN